jgi:hypothetical protein
MPTYKDANFNYAVITLLVLAAVTLTGIAVVTEFGDQLKSEARANHTESIVADAGTLTYDEVISFIALYNGTTVVWISNNETTSNEFNLTYTTGAFVTSGIPNGTDYTAVYTYYADTSASTTAETFNTGLAIFGSFCAILAITLIGKYVIGLFKRT